MSACSLYDRVFPSFRYMGGNTFLSPGGKLKYSGDCIGCPPYGDVSIYHNRERNPDHTQYTLGANCGENANGEVLERTEKLNDRGERIGTRCIVTMGTEPRIFWTEGEEYYIVGGPTVEVLRAFEASDEFKTWRRSQE
ncbi:MAG: hypothetical protein WBD16_05485 [Pyrinomonadaceae bacterium]